MLYYYSSNNITPYYCHLFNDALLSFPFLVYAVGSGCRYVRNNFLSLFCLPYVFHLQKPRSAIMYVLNIFIVSYDFETDTYECTLLPNGHCSFFVPLGYNTVRLLYAFNEIIQILFLVASFVYYYKLNKMLTIVHHMPSTNDKQRNRLYLRIAIMMGASIGISRLSFSSSWYFDSTSVLHISRFFYLIQQCVILLFFMCSKKMSQLCKERFCTTETLS